MDHVSRLLVLLSLVSVALSSSPHLPSLNGLAASRLSSLDSSSSSSSSSSCEASTCIGNSTATTTSSIFLPYYHCSFFVHDILNATEAGMNASAYVIAGPVPGLPTPFGALIAFDDKVTATPDYDSPEIGRARGKYLVDNLDNTSSSLLYEFTVTLYHRGTLCFMGQRPLELPRVTLGVFGCGGIYRSGTFLAEVSAVSFSPSGLNEVFHVRCLAEKKH